LICPNNYLYDEISNLTQDLESKNDKIFWTAYGKVSKVIKDNNDSILYRYDATGQRISKTFEGKTTFYIRDASGNVMATYEAPQPPAGGVLKELMIYGSARVGVYNGKSERMKATLGNKNYELSNHLGNVLVTITDNKFIATVGVFVAKVSSTTDYYPFGMAIVERTWQSKEYRYGFNTQEKDLDIDKSGNHTTAEFWEYDSRSGRRWNVEPLSWKYPHLSPYVVVANMPILALDPDGQEIIISFTNGLYASGHTIFCKVTYVNGRLFADGKEVNLATYGNHAFLTATFNALNQINSGGHGAYLLRNLESHEDEVIIERHPNKNFAKIGESVGFNINSTQAVPTTRGNIVPPIFISLAHELAHKDDELYGRTNSIFARHGDQDFFTVQNANGGTEAIEYTEIYATHMENLIRGENNLPIRNQYTLGTPQGKRDRLIDNNGNSNYFTTTPFSTLSPDRQHINLFPRTSINYSNARNYTPGYTNSALFGNEISRTPRVRRTKDFNKTFKQINGH
jgi:hypothetical protein